MMALHQGVGLLAMHPGSSSCIKMDFLSLCRETVGNVQALLRGANALNGLQCRDLSLKLFKTVHNVEELRYHCGGFTDLFEPALECLYRQYEKARLLVAKCCKEDWVTEALFQYNNSNEFRVILSEMGLCYCAIYDLAKEISETSTTDPWGFHLCEDLRESSMFMPASGPDIFKDVEALIRRIEESITSTEYDNRPQEIQYLQQCLARYCRESWGFHSCMPRMILPPEASEVIWREEAFLGQGSAGVVSKCKWRDGTFAVKRFHDNGVRLHSTFLKEAGILAGLSHPQVVKFLHVGSEPVTGDSFIVMELMQTSLAELIKDHAKRKVPFSYFEAIEIIVQIARAMRYVHGELVAHRDLKPLNVLVNKLNSSYLGVEYVVKVADFGLAKREVGLATELTMTRPNIGTTCYRAPEAFRGAPGKLNWFKADVYSFGVTCAHLLSLKRPYKDIPVGTMYHELMNGRRPEVRIPYPLKLMALIEDCWSTDPRSRPSFENICGKLEELKYEMLRGLSYPKFDYNLIGSTSYKFIQSALEVADSSSFTRKMDDAVDPPKTIQVRSNLSDQVELEETRDVDHLTSNDHRESSSTPVISRADFSDNHRRNFYENQCRVLKEQLSIAEEVFNRRAESPNDVSLDLVRPQLALAEFGRVVKKGKLLIEDCQHELCQKAYLRLPERTVAFVETLKELASVANLFSIAGVGIQVDNVLEGATLADQQELQAALNQWMESHDRIPCSAEECGRPLSEDSVLCLANQIRARLNNSSDIGDQNYVSMWRTSQGALEDVRQLGRGSDGTVFETKWLGDTYAKKEYDTIPEVFEQEANALVNLNHRNIVKLQAYSVRSGSCFFLMERMDSDLKEYMKGRMKRGICPPFSILASVDLMLQISEAMSHTNSKGMVHRDLKAANVLVKPVNDESQDEQGFVIAKLADFSLAKCKREVTTHLTRENIGTTFWRAPEMFRVAEALDTMCYPWKADVYSFGIVCSEILTGRIPFHHVTVVPSQFYKQITDPENPLRPQLPDECPESLASLIRECWRTQPLERPTFEEISRRLSDLKDRWLMEGCPRTNHVGVEPSKRKEALSACVSAATLPRPLTIKAKRSFLIQRCFTSWRLLVLSSLIVIFVIQLAVFGYWQFVLPC